MVLATKKSPKHVEAARQLREQILQHYKPGDMMESERTLADRYSVSYMTMRRTLDTLLKEGLICRYPRRGTVVTDRLSTGTFSIVVKHGLLKPTPWPYFQMICTALTERLQDTNPRWQVRINLANIKEPDGGVKLDLPSLETPERLRGIFSLHRLGEAESRQFEQAKIPVIVLGHNGGKYRVSFSYRELVEKSIDHLARKGCRRIGAILHTHLSEERTPPENAIRTTEEIISKAGLECRSEWISYCTRELSERVGYEMFMSLWKQSPQLDGLIVTDENLTRGVLRATLQMRIPMPDTLRLITHVTSGVELPYHLPVTRVEFDPLVQADRAVEMMLCLIRGNTPPQDVLILPANLVEGATT